MSFPNIPSVTPTINLDTQSIINLLLSSIAFEELALSHVINTQGELIQYSIGTLEGQTLENPLTVDQVIEVNNQAIQSMRGVVEDEMLTLFRLRDILKLDGFQVFLNTGTVTAEYDGTEVSDSDIAYYHTFRGGM